MTLPLSADVIMLASSGRSVLWHARTGRNLALPPGDLDDPSPGLLDRLRGLSMLADSPPPDLAALYPARSRLVLTLPDLPALWLPRPHHRDAGGHAWTERRLTANELALWRAMNGARTVAQVATRAGQPLALALDFLARLTGPDVQAVQLLPHPARGREPALARLVRPDRPPAPRTADQHGAEGQTTLLGYHQQAITDGATHFDDRETTVAHAFARPHPALGGQPYGAALHRALEARGLLPDDGPVLEIGPGTGELCAAFLQRAGERGLPRGEVLRLDASPALLATQERRLPGTRGILGSATAIPLPAGSVALVLCNEVIADLAAVPCDARDPSPGPEAAEVQARIRRYGLSPLPAEQGVPLYNLGAWRLLEELHRVLRPGGTAFLSEFGDLDELPTETRQLDHPEVSIHFGHLLQVARALGFEARCLPLPELLELDTTARWLSRHSYEGLRARFRAEGRHLEARAWTRESVPLPWPVEGLEEVTVAEEGPAPVPSRFMALLLRRGLQ
ncbi:class I SAM-dependent methyltransferase [Myxococcota bacterium]|nr:class I SAM-dependent methyltransferase [Myxococcota bacterium]